MSSRKAKIINGHVTTKEYHTISTTLLGVKILEGNDNNHSLPDYAHTPNSIYAKLKKNNKTLHEMRFYDDKGYPIIEIAYHPEPNINNGDRQTNIVHYHIFKGVERNKTPFKISEHPDIKEKYSEYLKEFELYDKC